VRRVDPAGRRAANRVLISGLATLATAAAGLLAPAGPASAAGGQPARPAGGQAAGGQATPGSLGAAWVTRAGTRGLLRATTTPASQVPADLAGYLQGDRTDLQWSLQATHVRQAWQASRGAGVIVATVDTGADTTAPDLAGQLLQGGYLTAAGTIAPGTRADGMGHGTHVAGIIAGRDDGHGITGVAPDAKVLPVDVDSTQDVLTGKQVATAITWAAGHGAQVINLSLGFSDVATGSTDVKAICQAVSGAVARDVVVVAAAGNDGDGLNDPEAPASCPGAISVAALDNDLHPTPWSSFDRSVTLAAPGAAVYSTVTAAVSPLRYAAESGTSMASPFVAGVAALLLSEHPGWTPKQVADRLVATASDLAPSGPDPRTGAGVVDPAAAVGVSAPAPEAVPALAVQADPYASHLDGNGIPVYDQVEVHWVPDPTFAVTGYRVTRWTSAGTTTTAVDGATVRALFPAGAAGYQVTAITASGDVPSAPLWFPLAGQDYTPLYPVTGLRAAWTASGGITLRWANPPKNAGRADQYAVLINGDVALSAQKVTIPTSTTVPASVVPSGDLVISVMLGSSSTLDIEETRVALTARVPFSGTAVSAGSGRYRVDLALAPSRRFQCGSGRCTGTLVTVTAGRYAHITRLDVNGHAVVLVSARASKGRITVGVTVAGRPKLGDRAVSVPVQ
jgi:subtilisin family serine protease